MIGSTRMTKQAIVASARLAGAGPYSARPAQAASPLWWYVTDDGNRNVLSFPGGAIFTTRDIAEAIARQANEVAS